MAKPSANVPLRGTFAEGLSYPMCQATLYAHSHLIITSSQTSTPTSLHLQNTQQEDTVAHPVAKSLPPDTRADLAVRVHVVII